MAKFGQERTELFYMIQEKEYVIKQIQNCVDHVECHCFYCNNCWYCLVTKKLQREADKKKLKSSTTDWWSVKGTKDKKGNNIPQLVSHGKSLW